MGNYRQMCGLYRVQKEVLEMISVIQGGVTWATLCGGYHELCVDVVEA